MDTYGKYSQLVNEGVISSDTEELINDLVYIKQRIAYTEGLSNGAQLQHLFLSGTLAESILDIYGDRIKEDMKI